MPHSVVCQIRFLVPDTRVNVYHEPAAAHVVVFSESLDLWLQGFGKSSEVHCLTTVFVGGCHGSPCERPKPNSLGAHLQIFGELFRDAIGITNNASHTVEKVLRRIVGWIAKEGFGIDGHAGITIRT